MEDLKSITCIVEKGLAQGVVAAAIDAGAHGATVLFGLGTGVRQQLGMEKELEINPDKQIITIIAHAEKASGIFDAVVAAGELTEPGRGFAYMQSVDKAVGFFED